MTINVESDFDYVGDFNGTIDFNSLNLNVRGNFSYDDLSDNFTWVENASLTVSGNADITTDNYTQSGVIDVTGTLAISAIGDFTNSTGGDISTGSLGLTVGNLIQNDGAIDTDILTIDTDTIHNPGNIIANTSLTITATNNVFSGGSIITNALDIDANRNFANHGDITADSLEITAENTVINDGTIVSGSLDVITADFFRNLTGGDISVDSLNITAGGKVTNTANITVAGTLSIIANNNSSRTDDPAGAFFYVANRGNITATNFNIAAEDNFYNRGDIYLTGNSSFRADGGRIENYGNIDLDSNNNLAITAFIFINHADATIDTIDTDDTDDAATLNLNVNTFIDDGSITATIIQ